MENNQKIEKLVTELHAEFHQRTNNTAAAVVLIHMDTEDQRTHVLNVVTGTGRDLFALLVDKAQGDEDFRQVLLMASTYLMMHMNHDEG